MTGADSASTGPSIAIFDSQLVDYGGAERLVFEEAAALNSRGWRATIITLRFDPKVRFGGVYRQAVETVPTRGFWNLLGKPGRFIGSELGLIRWLRRVRPALVIALSATDCAYLLVPAVLTRTRYIVHINGTVLWFPADLMKYALVHRGGLKRILDRYPFSRQFVSDRPPRTSLLRRIKTEVSTSLHWLGVRRARRRISFSRRMAWEATQFYGKPAEEIKGAFPESALTYEGTADPLAPYRRNGGPVVLNVNRLESRKRVGLAIRAFAEVAKHWSDVTLVIGGRGPDARALQDLCAELGVSHRVFFVGFIAEHDLLEWLAACDVFVHPNWADFAIAPYEALALGRKVVWSSEMEMDPEVEATGLVFAADPFVGPTADALERALAAPAPSPTVRAHLRRYSWESYFDQLEAIVAAEAARP